jgi:hypothetical protein
MISVVGGAVITLKAGSSALFGIGTAAGHGSFAFITADGDSQQINFTDPGGAINLTGGTVGSRNNAGILARNGSQTIKGSPSIVLTGGANGGATAKATSRAFLPTMARRPFTPAT